MRPHHAKPALAAALFALAMPAAWPHNEAHAHRHAGTDAAGEAGSPAGISRTIAIDLLDSMRFGPADITVRQGETIRFVVANKGALPHEFALGTPDALKAHGEAMKTHPHAAHDSPSAVRVEPGRQKSLVWRFGQPGVFHYACLIPGHFEAGMAGTIRIVKR